MSVLRTCRVCGFQATAQGQLDFFKVRKDRKYGVDNICKECCNAQARAKHKPGKRSEQQKKRVQQNKVKAIKYKEGKCQKCGIEYNGTNAAVFDFHHLEPNTKEKNPASLMDNGWDKIKQEIDKCILLCSNCHRLEHSEEY